MGHECYYCDQLFDSKEKLFDHLDVHSDTKITQEFKNKGKVLDKKSQKSLKNDQNHG